MSIFKEGRAGTATGGQTYTPFTGDAGSGGLSGLVPAPAAGDGLAGKYLGADGVWSVPAGGGGGGSDSTLLSRISALEYNIAVNTLRDLVKDGWLGPQAMTYGYADEFTDETGIDVAACVGQQYDSSNNLYATGSGDTIGTPALWSQTTAFTYTGANVVLNSTGHASCRSASIFSGDFALSFNAHFQGGNWNEYFGVYAAAEDASFTTGMAGNMSAMANAFFAYGSGGVGSTSYLYNKTGASFTIGSNALVTVSRTGNTIACSVAGSQVWSGTFTGGAMRIVIGAYMSSDAYNNISVTGFTGNPENISLQSIAMTALAAPTEIRNVLVVEPIDTITPNTDLMLSVSNDGGATWIPATLTLADKFDATRTIYVAKTAVAAAGTAVKWKIATANTKQLKIHGIWTQWR